MTDINELRRQANKVLNEEVEKIFKSLKPYTSANEIRWCLTGSLNTLAEAFALIYRPHATDELEALKEKEKYLLDKEFEVNKKLQFLNSEEYKMKLMQEEVIESIVKQRIHDKLEQWMAEDYNEYY